MSSQPFVLRWEADGEHHVGCLPARVVVGVHRVVHEGRLHRAQQRALARLASRCPPSTARDHRGTRRRLGVASEGAGERDDARVRDAPYQRARPVGGRSRPAHVHEVEPQAPQPVAEAVLHPVGLANPARCAHAAGLGLGPRVGGIGAMAKEGGPAGPLPAVASRPDRDARLPRAAPPAERQCVEALGRPQRPRHHPRSPSRRLAEQRTLPAAGHGELHRLGPVGADGERRRDDREQCEHADERGGEEGPLHHASKHRARACDSA